MTRMSLEGESPIPESPELGGHLTTKRDKILVPNGVHYRGVPAKGSVGWTSKMFVNSMLHLPQE